MTNPNTKKSRKFREPRYSWDAYRLSRSGRKISQWLTTPGISSEIIHHLSESVQNAEQAPLPVWLYCRKSNGGNDNLPEQTADAINRLNQMDVWIVDCTSCVETSDIFAWRPGLEEAIQGAREKNAILVSPMRDRILRNGCFDGTNEREPPVVAELKWLERLLDGVRIATILHPDAAPGENRSSATIRGKKTKGNPGGRPIRGRRKYHDKWQPIVVKMRAAGRSLRQISSEITKKSGRRISHTSINNWLNQADVL